MNIPRSSRDFKRRRRCDSSRPRRAGERVDPHFLRRALRAHFVIDEAERHGIVFSIEGGKLAVTYPLSINGRFWRDLQDAILANKQTIANYVYSPERGIL